MRHLADVAASIDPVQVAAAAPPRDDVVADRLRASLRSALLGTREHVGVGRYELRERIGAGGMGVVYRGFDPELRREVAIKLIPIQGDPARALREARAMASVTHDNVLPVYDVGVRGSELYVVMALARGGTFAGWCEVPRSTAQRVTMMLMAGAGLAAAHRVGVVHHDFKPTNLLLTEAEQLLVSDFGLAAIAADGGSDTASDSAGDTACPDEVGRRERTSRGGTFGYCAPERLAGDRGDARSDQFSYCVTFVEVLTGRRLLPHGDPHAQQRAIEAGLPRPAEVPASLWSVLRRGLSARPRDRFATMDALVRAIGRSRSRGRRRVAAGLLCVASLAGLAGLVGLVGLANASEVASSELVEAPTVAIADARDEPLAAALRLARSEQALPDRFVRPCSNLAWVLAAHTPSEAQRAWATYEYSVSAGSAGHGGTYEALLHRGLEQGSGDDLLVVAAYTRLITLLATKGELEAALRLEPVVRGALARLDSTVVTNRAQWEASFEVRIASVYEGLQRTDEAREHYARACTADPSSRPCGDGLTGLVQLALAAGNLEEAERQARRAAQIPTSRRDALIALAGISGVRGRPREAVDTYTELLPELERIMGPTDPALSVARVNAALSHMALGELSQAMALYDRVIAIEEEREHPDAILSDAYAMRGATGYELDGDPRAALEWYAKARVVTESRGQGDSPEALQYRVEAAQYEGELGRHQAAMRSLAEVIEAATELGEPGRPALTLALVVRGRLRLSTDEPADAEQDFRMVIAGEVAVDLPPVVVHEVYDGLADIHRRRGERSEAIAMLERDLSLLEENGLGGDRLGRSALSLAELVADEQPQRARDLARRASVALPDDPMAARLARGT